ncbi:MAG: hypothetical protein ACR2MD_17755 [Aridibacter sp.]
MKNYIFLIVLVLSVFVINSQTINAQDKRLDSSPKNFRTFFAKFKNAVAKNDKTKVSSMTCFLFQYGFDEGDEGTLSKTRFIEKFDEFFGESPSEFFTEKNPLFSKGDDGTYYILTENAVSLAFKKKGKSFMFIAYIVLP